jgi:hypothetical protein
VPNPPNHAYRLTDANPESIVSTPETMRRQHISWMRHNGTTVIVCGGRDYKDRERVFAALDQMRAKHSGFLLIAHGGAPGADTLAGEWARERGIACEVFPADWEGRGPAAGPERNQRMIDAGANGCVAFPGGRGTADCVRRCEATGIPVWRPFG